jgi:hypothetical protein
LSRLSRRGLIVGASSLVVSQAKPAKQLCGFVPDAPSQPVCGPTVDLQPYVRWTGNVNGMTASSVNMFAGSPFSFWLHSSWHCNPFTTIGGSDLINAQINITHFGVTIGPNGTGPSCEVRVYKAGAVIIFDGTFALPANMQWNVLVSVNCDTQTVQVYCNDQLATQLTGGWTGTGQYPGMSDVSAFSVLDIGTDFGSGGRPAVSDIWEANTPTWIDLSVVANRRRFINADLTPKDLGPHGENPLGYVPPLFLRATGSPDNIRVNKGSKVATYTLSGGISVDWQPAGQCPCPSSVAQVMLWVRGNLSSGNAAGPYFASTKDSGGSWTKTQRTDALSGDAWGSAFVPVNENNPLAQVLVVDSYVNPSYGAVWSTAGYSFLCSPVANASGWCLTSVSGFPSATVKPWWNNASIVTNHPNVAHAPWQSYTGAVFGGKIVLAGLNCGATGSFSLNYETGASGDGGTTWTMGGNDSAIALTSGLFYSNQWFSGGTTGRTAFAAPQGGAYVYVLEANGGFVCKSSDGLHWTSLKTGDLPQTLWTPTGQNIVQCSGDIKCDKTGQIIAFYGKMYNSDGTTARECSFWLSTNGGASWSEKANRTTLGIPNGVANSFGMTPDGSKFVICASNSIGSGTFLFRSVDGGNSWAAMSPPSAANNPWQCGISPDGNSIAMMYSAPGPGWTSANKTTMIDVTANQGLSWVTSDAPWDFASMSAEMWVFNTGS